MHLFPERLSEKIGFDTVRSAAVTKARSQMAQEQLASMMPFSDRQVINRRLSQTGEMMDLLQNDSAFPLRNLHDVEDFLEKARPKNSIIPLQAFIKILELNITARRIKSYIEQREEYYPALKEVSIGLIPLEDLEETLQDVLTENGELRNDASPKLKSIRNKIKSQRNNLRTTINRVMGRLSKQGMTSDEGPTIRSGRMVIPVQAEYKRKVKGFVHDVSSSGQTVYIEPVDALTINNEIRELESEEKQEIERILRELTAHIRDKRDSIRQNMKVLTTFDIIAAKAQLSIDLNGFTPVISETSHLYFKEAYNPLLLLKNQELPKNEQENVVPLDMELSEDERCLVITGPNAGGKSVALKTLALCSMMMQAGFAIPARDSSEIPVFNSIFVDMGDDQSIENDLSTFSSRLEWMKHTLNHADEHSLVLIDEAAAGTDPEEGGALFQSLIEQLMERKSKILVTTHHGSLKVFAHEHEYAVNGSMEFDQDTLSPTYHFKKGVPGSSYAFEIAERMELQDDLLNQARLLLGEAKSDMETLISELETKSQEAEELKQRYDKLKENTEKERHRYEEKRSAIEKEKEQIREKALKEAKKIMDSANQKIERAVERIVSEGEKDEQTIKQARSEVEKHQQKVDTELKKLEDKREQQYQDSKEKPKIGDLVRLQDGNTTGELKEIDGDKAVVLASGLRLKTKYNKLVKVKGASDQKSKQKVKVNFEDGSRHKMVKPQLSIRGMRGNEAMKKVQTYLDNAIAAGRDQVQIVHGKGKGILKNLVHEYLDQRNEVKGYQMAPIQQGGNGCTVVEFK
ncbi:DNA mismatch repair protein MutS2 [Fodinibius salinus]|uniref:Endonuclease MutS2 n=1 Tax=Fodinibius salinus TaxID=860790 RepID=A0A5D3YIU1_9BACT|nr:endonuclease MutS2 [Fodinibius salinus]TYP92224.1 DNA mismatch repair protein MutS2 [Fodinibius salinus]